MKKYAFIAVLVHLLSLSANAQIYMADSCNIGFFSAATVEDIAAINNTSIPIMSTATNDIQISISNEGFIFKKKLMQEHFNEEYMESTKYPRTVFKGKVNEQVDYTKDGVNNVTVTGTLEMHGVTKNITIPGTITITNGVIVLHAKFDVKVADYNIKIPSLLGSNIAEVVTVTLDARMKPYQVKK